MSVALVYVVVSVSDIEFWIVTVSVLVSTRLSVSTNLWLASEVSTGGALIDKVSSLAN